MTQLRLRGADLAWQDLDGDIVALEPTASVYLTTNAAGALLWRLLARGATHDELVGALVAAYGLPAADAAQDVDAFVEDLRIRELLAA
ncbi:MAG TPA: PqqD family protein [Solirubrobacteraceae bacterium]|nr:PqqD family protein [Solirubrobacteraceae bacterium]